MDKYPAFRSQSSRVSKHVTITSELSRLVETCSLFEISALEQDLACGDDHKVQLRGLTEMLASPEINAVDKLRLGLLYGLRYETTGDLGALKDNLVSGGVPRAQVDLLDKMLQYAGQAQRPPGLFGEAKGFFGKLKKHVGGGALVESRMCTHAMSPFWPKFLTRSRNRHCTRGTTPSLAGAIVGPRTLRPKHPHVSSSGSWAEPRTRNLLMLPRSMGMALGSPWSLAAPVSTTLQASCASLR